MEKIFCKTFRQALKEANWIVRQSGYDNYMDFKGIEDDQSLMNAERIGFEPDFTFSGEVQCITLFDKELNPVVRVAWYENDTDDIIR